MSRDSEFDRHPHPPTFNPHRYKRLLAPGREAVISHLWQHFAQPHTDQSLLQLQKEAGFESDSTKDPALLMAKSIRRLLERLGYPNLQFYTIESEDRHLLGYKAKDGSLFHLWPFPFDTDHRFYELKEFICSGKVKKQHTIAPFITPIQRKMMFYILQNHSDGTGYSLSEMIAAIKSDYEDSTLQQYYPILKQRLRAYNTNLDSPWSYQFESVSRGIKGQDFLTKTKRSKR